MVGMNTAGGPVGGTPTMNNRRNLPMDDANKQLNTYIYEYLLKNSHYQTARLFKEEAPVKLKSGQKGNPNGRALNGVDALDTDSKANGLQGRPDDLELPDVPENQLTDNSFLLDWWYQFWELFGAARGRGGTPSAHNYLNHTRAATQVRNDQQNRMLTAPAMQYRNMMQQMPNGMGIPNDLQRKAMQNNRNPQQLQQMQQNMKNQQALMSAQMSRDGSGMDLGQRPQSPGSANNAPSPNKRPRLEGNAFNGQPMGGARSQGMGQQPMGATSTAANAHQMMATNGLNPGDMSGQFEFASQAQNAQQKSIEVYTQSLAHQQRTAFNHTMAKGMNPGIPQGSPMGQGGLEGSQDLFNSTPRMPGGAPGQPQGNHALQDYQMQLMLLEQQNKKRLMMARQEQDNMAQGPHGQPPVNAQGFAPSMSPSGSRAGPSPNPNDQMRKQTPKMGPQGLPGSPMAADMQQNRNSPGPNGFDPSQMPPGMPPQYYQQMPNNAMMRPPSSHPQFNGQFTPQQMETIQRNGGRIPNGVNWPQGPQLMPNQGQQPGGPMGTPLQRNSAMPPPPAPPTGEPARTQPSSPAQPPAPPTPSQGTKANPRKKDTKETKKKPTKKNTGNAANAPATEGDTAPTPTPSTPITPMNANSFNPSQKNGQQGNVQSQQSVAAPAPQVQQPPMDNPGAPFGNLGEEFNGLDFPAVDGPDVLENFDFDSFLHTEDTGAFGPLGGDFNFGLDGVEAGGDL
ncbi:hypothetical protein BU16DRAFT_540518 [Lophium mytilinum]|uniref:Uncharacterized protein n=1 Tax=Lophium mytilinum TaxID=390894 RepID=A0A6A6QPC2_9PEZI|nr:hypothetical protein BU16DRAFT_540518 [Lophium mytilinum]